MYLSPELERLLQEFLDSLRCDPAWTAETVVELEAKIRDILSDVRAERD